MARIASLFVVVILTTTQLFAQIPPQTRGTMDITEGREYMVSFFPVLTSELEKPLPQPMVLLISSRVNTKVRVETPSNINPNGRIDRTYDVIADEMLQVPIPLPYLPDESGVLTGFGVRVKSEHPVSVNTYMMWLGTGEVTRHYPVSVWGTEYRTVNTWEDRYGSTTTGYTSTPPSMVLIAHEDETEITIESKRPLQTGQDVEDIGDNKYKVTMDHGDVVCLDWELTEGGAGARELYTDPSGTHVVGNKPFAVMSGSREAAVMRYPDLLPPTGRFAADAVFVRSNLHETLLPTSFGDTSFITIPHMYTPTRVTGQASEEFGIDDDKGDVIRFVAVVDSTIVCRLNPDGSDKELGMINAGETWMEVSVEDATIWKTSKPCMLYQYGKSYAKILPPSFDVEQKRGALGQGHPTVESGMPCLATVPPVSHFVSYGTFRSQEGMDNFFNIVFKPEDAGSIKIDGVALNSRFGNAERMIDGTPYAYIRANIGTGDHYVKSESDDIKWMAWTYGSLDGLQHGRAYSTPVAVELSEPCDDEVVLGGTIVCYGYDASAEVISEGDCGRIADVYLEESDNFTLTLDEELDSETTFSSFSLRAVDTTRLAEATLIAVTRSGKFQRQYYRYTPDTVSFDPGSLNFGVISTGIKVCDTITVTNESGDSVLVIDTVDFKYNSEYFTVEPSSFTLPPGASIQVRVCITYDKANELIDTMLLRTACGVIAGPEVIARGDEPVIYVSDRDWGNVPPNSPGIEKSVEIVNSSDVDLVITDYDRSLLDGSGNFFNPRNLDEVLPLTLGPRARHTWYVTYSPKGEEGVRHCVDVPFYSNATREDSIAILCGGGVTSVDEEEVQATLLLYPQPLSLSTDGELVLGMISTDVSVTLTDLNSRTVWSGTVGVSGVIKTSVFSSPGLYTLSFEQYGSVQRYTVVVVE